MLDIIELVNKINLSRDRILLKVRGEILSFYNMIKSLSQEEKKCDDLSDYDIQIIMDLLEKDIEYRGAFDDLDALKILMEALQKYQSERINRRPYALNHGRNAIDKAVDNGIDFFKAYEGFFYNDGPHSKFACNNKEIQITDSEGGEVQFSFNMEDGMVIDKTPWKTLPEDTREFLATYIVSGFLEQELLKHQLDLRKIGQECITLDDFMDKYSRMKDSVKLGEIGKEELDAYVSQYAKAGVEDVIILSEENISEILSFCKAEIMQNALEQDEVICDSEHADRFIRNLLVLHRRRLENDSEALEKIDKYIEFFDISKGIGLRKNDVMGEYYYGGNIGLAHTFSYTGEEYFKIGRDKWGDNKKYLSRHNLEELRKVDEGRNASNGGNPITIDDYLKWKVTRGVTSFLRQEIVAKQIKIRNSDKDDSVCYLDDLPQLERLRKLYRDAGCDDKKIDEDVEKDVRFIRDFERDIINRKGAILLTDENVDELIGLVSEAMQRYDYGNMQNYRGFFRSVYDFADYMLKSLKKDLMEEEDSPEKAKKLAKIEIYNEYVKVAHDLRKYDENEDRYYYKIGIGGSTDAEVCLNMCGRNYAYTMKNGCEVINDVFNVLDSLQCESGYLSELDREEKDAKTDERMGGIFSKDSLRIIYGESEKSRRKEFKMKMERAIEYFETER